MNNNSVKIKDIYIENLKNVSKGKINFLDENKFLNILGVYGQNGSGKTALVDALTIIKILLLGNKLKNSELDLLNEDKETLIKITLNFKNIKEVTYTVILKKENEKAKVISEELYQKRLEKYQRDKKIFKYKTSSEADDFDFGSLRMNFSMEEQVELRTAAALAQENETSFIFSDKFKKFIKNNQDLSYSDLLNTIQLLVEDFERNLFIYSNKLSGMIYAEIFLPMSFQVKNASGLVPLPMESSENIPKDIYETAFLIFEQINEVLKRLIPGMMVKLNVEDKSRINESEFEYKVSVDSYRDGVKIPFRKESDGIKKIVSILSTLINVYNSPEVIAVIDELDAGIFEFLLGEIVEILSDDAKGQLIFTSHNLRALEVLPYKKIIFTTANPNNRYIRINNVKRTNNLRDIYLRAIQLGGMEEELYSETDSYEIKRAFRKAYKKEK